MVDRTIIEDGYGDSIKPNNKSGESVTARTIVEESPSGKEGTELQDIRESDRTVVENDGLTNNTGQPQAQKGAPDATVYDDSTRKVMKKLKPAGDDIHQMIGKVIQNKFKVIRVIGEGGMGVVYEAEHLDLRKRFAIKSIRSEYTQDPKFNLRFDQEAKTQALLQHPNIIQVTDFIRMDGHFYMVMEYVDGKGLDTLIRDNQLTEDEMLSIVKDVLKGLGHAHSEGIVHRDIKPSNIIVTKDKTAKIMDFGIALLTGEGRTEHQGVAGTPPYMSPEQFNQSNEMDHRSDIYSMGIVMFEMLCGYRPFDGDTDHETRMNHVHRKLPDINSVFSDSTPELSMVIQKALGKNPIDRFDDCAIFLDQIEAYERQTHIECRSCKVINRVENKYKLKGERCIHCGKTLFVKSKFTKIWAVAFATAAALILVYLLYPWSGTLVVNTSPEKAQILLNGEQKGVSPLKIKLDPGSYEVLVRIDDTYEEVLRPAEIEKKKTTELTIEIPKTDEIPRRAHEAVQKAYQTTAYICQDLNYLKTSEKNLGIAKSIGNSALTEGYQRQVLDLEKNVEEGLGKYREYFQELKAIRTEIRNNEYGKYVQSLKVKNGNVANLAIVWKHFEQYAAGQYGEDVWKEEIIKFCN